MTPDLKQKVIDRLRELVPELNEPTFGCRLLREGKKEYQIICEKGFAGDKSKIWVNSVPFGVMPIEIEKLSLHANAEWQILGHDPTLAHVLLVIEKECKVDVSLKPDGKLLVEGKIPHFAKWHLPHPLSLQPDPVWVLLAEVLNVE